MPKQYEAIRDKFIAKGMGTAEAKTHAAKIYNSTHHSKPVTRNMGYAKGGNVWNTSYAEGGSVLGRTRDFLKTPNEFSEIDHGSNKTDENWGKGKGDSLAKRTGDKSLKPVKPR